MKGLKLILASICILLTLVLLSIGILIGGGRGSEPVVMFSIVPLIMMAIGLYKKD